MSGRPTMYRVECRDCGAGATRRFTRRGARVAASRHAESTGHGLVVAEVDGDETFVVGPDGAEG